MTGDKAMKQWSDRASVNGGNLGNIGGRFGRDGNEIWMGFNAKGMEWKRMFWDSNLQPVQPV